MDSRNRTQLLKMNGDINNKIIQVRLSGEMPMTAQPYIQRWTCSVIKDIKMLDKLDLFFIKLHFFLSFSLDSRKLNDSVRITIFT